MLGHKPLTHRVKLARSGHEKRVQQEARSREIAASGLAVVDQITKCGQGFYCLYHIVECMDGTVSFVGERGAYRRTGGMEADVPRMDSLSTQRALHFNTHTISGTIAARECSVCSGLMSLEFTWIARYKLPENFSVPRHHLQLEVLDASPVDPPHTVPIDYGEIFNDFPFRYFAQCSNLAMLCNRQQCASKMNGRRNTFPTIAPFPILAFTSTTEPSPIFLASTIAPVSTTTPFSINTPSVWPLEGAL